jgi:hypothetical protein
VPDNYGIHCTPRAFLLRERQRNHEGRADAERARDLDLPTVLLDDAARDGQAEAAATSEARLTELHAAGVSAARLYGPELDGVGGTNALFLLVDEPQVYNLPPAPVVPQKTQADAWRSVAVGAAAMALLAFGVVLTARGRR